MRAKTKPIHFKRSTFRHSKEDKIVKHLETPDGHVGIYTCFTKGGRQCDTIDWELIDRAIKLAI